MLDRHDIVAVVVALTAALFAVILAVVAAALLAAPATGALPGGAPSASCREWTDGCVVCRRAPDGPACSTPGIACTRGPARCLAP
jgi:hypothetical protein